MQCSKMESYNKAKLHIPFRFSWSRRVMVLGDFVDYRALNAITSRDRFHTPHVEDLVDELNGSVVFSEFDLRSRHQQI